LADASLAGSRRLSLLSSGRPMGPGLPSPACCAQPVGSGP